jgi:hypothetical protein
LPALAQGDNTVRCSVGPQTGTITLEGHMHPEEGRQAPVQHMDYQPALNGLSPIWLRVGDNGKGEATYTIRTPGAMTGLRLNAHYRARDAGDSYEVQASWDGGKTYTKVGELSGPTSGTNQYITVQDVAAGTQEARVRFLGNQRNTTCIFDLRIDADYTEPTGGFRPVKITYVWEENGQEQQHVHVARQPSESYTIRCDGVPLMKTITLEPELP